MGRILAIGIGNELRGDDAAGVVAARRLAALHPEVRTTMVQQLTADLAIGLGAFETVLFLDADVETCEVVCRPVKPSFDRMTVDPHHMTPGQLLAIAEALDEPRPRYAFEVGIPACRFDHGMPLSDVAAVGVDRVHDCVAGLFEGEHAQV